MAIFHRRRELPSTDRRNRFLVETHAEAALHSEVTRVAGGIHDQPQHYCALVLGFTRLVGVLGIGREGRTRRTHSSSDPVHTPADTPTPPRTNARPTAAADASTIAATNPAARARAIRRGTDNAKYWIAEIRQRGIRDLYLRRHCDRRLHGELG